MNLIVVTGQTATGKTKLALELAKKHNGELINCDSRQVYKSLDIITGKDISPKDKFNLIHKLAQFAIGNYLIPYPDKPKSSKKSNIPIWLYDIISPKELFSAVEYKKCALWVIKNIIKRGKIPIIVGGTYFYLQHLLYNNITINILPNKTLRSKLINKSTVELQSELKHLDSKLFENLNNSEKNNPQRLMRKIEISLSQQFLLPTQLKRQPEQSIEEFLFKISEKKSKIKIIGLKFKHKEDLEKTIKNRVEKRLDQGAIEEVRNLFKIGYKQDNPGLRTIGYQQIIKYLKGNLSKEEVVKEWITKETQYAKRQYTFMKKDKNIEWKEV